MSLIIDKRVTNYTSKHSKVFIDTYQGQRALFIKKYNYKEFVNPKQLNHVINDIVINKGFIMDKQKKDQIIFTHSHNTLESKTIYNIWTKTSEVEKITNEFLCFV